MSDAFGRIQTMRYTVSEIAEGMGAKILCGHPEESVTGFSFSSKDGDADTMFLPMKGERVDAHDFIADAYAHGMRVTTTERGEIVPGTEDMTYLLVENARDAWQRLGAYWRDKHASVPMVAITGSVGKTTTKELIATALTPLGKVLRTEGNKNGQLGVPQMMAELTDDTDVAVIEMGMSLPGEMGRIAAVAKPNCAVITNIGVSHIGNLGSQEAIRREKLAIANKIADGGMLLVNGDDPLLAPLCPDNPEYCGTDGIEMYEPTREHFPKITVAAYGAADWCRYRYTEEKLSEDSAAFSVITPKETVQVSLPVPGHHNVSNATAALGIAELFGLSAEKAAEALLAYRPMAMRGGIETLPNGITLIDDTYNASPDSMRSGLNVLCAVKAERRIAVLADILELGEHSEECHRQVGRDVAERPIDILIAVGTEAAAISDEAGKTARGSAGERQIVHAPTREEAFDILRQVMKSGDAILLKGSRGMGMDVIAGALRDMAKGGPQDA